MSTYKLIYDYKEYSKYRESFFELAVMTFGINFRDWYERGFWTEQYVCYSYIDVQTDQVVANVSINKMDVLIKGERKKAIQIGTVMTHPEHRHQGLAAKLMNIVLEVCTKYDLLFLFANHTVLEFYPKFGFKSVNESKFSMPLGPYTGSTNKLRKLEPTSASDLAIIKETYINKRPLSFKLDVINAYHLLTFYLTYFFHNNVYYLEEQETIVIYREQDDTLHLYDVISKREVELEVILNQIRQAKETNEVVFYFTPELQKIEINTFPLNKEDDILFIKASTLNIDFPFSFPITAHS